MGLAKHQEGWRKGGAHCLDIDKLVRRARSLALATSYTHKLFVRFQWFYGGPEGHSAAVFSTCMVFCT